MRARPNQNVSLTPLVSIASQATSDQPNIVTVAVSKQDSLIGQSAGVQIKTSGNLTPAQQQQILQTIKQKILPSTSVLAANQQQIVLKQKGLPTTTLSGGKVQVQQQKIGGAGTVCMFRLLELSAYFIQFCTLYDCGFVLYSVNNNTNNCITF